MDQFEGLVNIQEVRLNALMANCDSKKVLGIDFHQ